MNSWTDINARKSAVRAFVEYLQKPENQGDRNRCKSDRPFAKKLFADKGGFEIGGSVPDDKKIPEKMEFRVYEEKDTKQRDEDLGVMVLPAKPQTPVDVSQVWRCTWEDWTSFQGQTPQTKSS
jgi:ABC-type glycerol-3-phosphate transport system substrate-binding protein